MFYWVSLFFHSPPFWERLPHEPIFPTTNQSYCNHQIPHSVFSSPCPLWYAPSPPTCSSVSSVAKTSPVLGSPTTKGVGDVRVLGIPFRRLPKKVHMKTKALTTCPNAKGKVNREVTTNLQTTNLQMTRSTQTTMALAQLKLSSTTMKIPTKIPVHPLPSLHGRISTNNMINTPLTPSKMAYHPPMQWRRSRLSLEPKLTTPSSNNTSNTTTRATFALPSLPLKVPK